VLASGGQKQSRRESGYEVVGGSGERAVGMAMYDQVSKEPSSPLVHHLRLMSCYHAVVHHSEKDLTACMILISTRPAMRLF